MAMIPVMKVGPVKGKQKNAIGDVLDNLVGAEGFKADVAVKIAPATIPIIIVSVVAAIIIGSVASHFIIAKLKK